MPLPKVNTPTYDLTLPSGKRIKYRPFLVREEKILIMALETEDMKQITSAVLDILNSCILTKNVKIENLPLLERLFIHFIQLQLIDGVKIMYFWLEMPLIRCLRLWDKE